MTDATSQQSVSKSEMDLWDRVIGRRKAEWSLLSRDTLAVIVRPLWSNEPSPPAINDPWQQTEWILTRYFNLAVDRRISPKKRRAAWRCVNTLLVKLDSSRNSSKSRSKNDGIDVAAKQNGAAPPRKNSEKAPIVAQNKPTIQSAPNRSSSTAKKPAAKTSHAPAPSALVQKSSAKTAAPQLQKKLQKEPPKQQQKAPPQSQPVALSSKPATNASATPPRRATPTPPTNTTTIAQRPSAASKQNIGSTMGSAFSSTTKVAPMTSAATTKSVVPKKKNAPPRPPCVPVSISFVADTNRYAAAVDKGGRSSVRATFSSRPITSEEAQRTLSRLEKFDPYWKVQHLVAMVKTFPITRLENLKTGTKPLQATECTIRLEPQYTATVRDWGKALPKGTKRAYKHGEMRLVVRMLPVNPAQKKRPRADTHLWPKGTFVQLNGLPVMIDQRRQQQHDPKEWKSMSTPLDLTSRLARPKNKNVLQLYFLDNEPYILCVALCRYVAPNVLNRAVWDQNWIKKLTMEQAKTKALVNANRQTVVLDDDTEASNEVSSFIFPLTCPVSQQLLKTPVRGQNCSHWQCFDLQNYVESNSHVTGTRWECPVCAKILSLRDLEYCPLTASILKEYETKATPHRDRVQFFANMTWNLLDETKKRYSKKRPTESENLNGNKRPRMDGSAPSSKGSPEVIELL